MHVDPCQLLRFYHLEATKDSQKPACTMILPRDSASETSARLWVNSKAFPRIPWVNCPMHVKP